MAYVKRDKNNNIIALYATRQRDKRGNIIENQEWIEDTKQEVIDFKTKKRDLNKKEK